MCIAIGFSDPVFACGMMPLSWQMYVPLHMLHFPGAVGFVCHPGVNSSEHRWVPGLGMISSNLTTSARLTGGFLMVSVTGGARPVVACWVGEVPCASPM